MTTTGSVAPGDGEVDPEEAIRRELEAMLANGQRPDPEKLEARWPGQRELIRKLAAEAELAWRLQTPLEARPRREPRTGDVLGDFRIVREIGRGGMGSVVYRALQLSLGDREVALKVFPSDGVGVRDVERFRQEALRAAGLHHPSLAEIHGFGSTGGWMFYAMRLVEGPTLRVVLERLAAKPGVRANEENRKTIVHQMAEVADALALLHEHRLAHRDVKPGNILFENDGNPIPTASPVLVDFGLARSFVAQAGEETHGTSGTFAYMPPEQRDGRPVDARADVFSLGATLHDALAGRLPHDRKLAWSKLERLDELVPGFDRDLAAVVEKAVEPEPQWRYDDAAALRDDLRAWLDDRQVTARRPMPVEVARRWLHHNSERVLRRLTQVAAVAVATLAIAWVAVTYAESREARHAAESGDLRALAASLGAIPTWCSGFLLSTELERLKREFQDPNPTDPVADVHRALEEDRWEDALLIAAQYLERDGLQRHNLLASFLRGSIDLVENDGLSATTERRSRAILMTSRLFMDRPVCSRALSEAQLLTDGYETDIAGGRLFADRLVRVLDRSENGEDRLNALTALSGCATAEFVPTLMARIGGPGAGPLPNEEQRLTLFACARILRRTLARGALEELDSRSSADLLKQASDYTRALAASGEPPSSHRQIWAGWCEFLEALALLERRRGAPVSFSHLSWDPCDPDDNTSCTWEHISDELARLYSAAAMPEIRDALRDGRLRHGMRSFRLRTDELHRRHYEGLLAGLAEIEEELRNGELEFLRQADGGGWSEGVAAQLGLKPTFESNGDSHLGALLDASEEPSLLKVSTGPGSPRHRPNDSEKAYLAQWGFGEGSVIAAKGWTLPVARGFGGAAPAESGDDYCLFPQFGRSELRLEFEVPPEGCGGKARLVIQGLSAGRRYVPFDGQAVVDVFLDTHSVGQAVTRWKSVEPWSTVLVEGALLPGRHTIALRLSAATTTYRLEDVHLELCK